MNFVLRMSLVCLSSICVHELVASGKPPLSPRSRTKFIASKNRSSSACIAIENVAQSLVACCLNDSSLSKKSLAIRTEISDEEYDACFDAVQSHRKDSTHFNRLNNESVRRIAFAQRK